MSSENMGDFNDLRDYMLYQNHILPQPVKWYKQLAKDLFGFFRKYCKMRKYFKHDPRRIDEGFDFDSKKI